MAILNNDERAQLKAALDVAWSGTGRPLGDERKTVEAILWRWLGLTAETVFDPCQNIRAGATVLTALIPTRVKSDL